MSILVTTPTGTVGSQIVDRLIEHQADVSVVARTPDALPARIHAHATVHRGDLEDAEALADAASGADAAFLLVPPNIQADDERAWQRQIGQSAVDAFQSAGVQRVVFLSSGGAQRDDLGPISGLGDVEELLKGAFDHVVSLRAAYFMENFVGDLESIAQEGTMYGVYDPDTSFPAVATRDIADVAVQWLLDDDWSGHHIVGIHGPEDVTMEEVAEAVGNAFGREIHYEQVPSEAVKQQFMEMGASESVAENYREMTENLETYGTDYAAEERTEATTTPTSVDTFIEETLQPAFEVRQSKTVRDDMTQEDEMREAQAR